MSEFKLREKATIEVEIVGFDQKNLVHVNDANGMSYWVTKDVLRKSATPQPMDASAIHVGDGVTVRAVISDIDTGDDEYPFEVIVGLNERNAWIESADIIHHSPKSLALPCDVASRFGTLSDDDKRKVLTLLEGK